MCRRLFESERYANRGIGGPDDLGRYEVTKLEKDRGAFRVPTLRNVRETGPYFHDGSVVKLADASRTRRSGRTRKARAGSSRPTRSPPSPPSSTRR